MSNSTNPKLRLTSVDRIVRSDDFAPLVENWGFASVVEAVRATQEKLREDRTRSSDLDMEQYASQVCRWLEMHRHHGYQSVFNLTGTILHTNLGRAVLDEKLVQRAMYAATRPVTLEFDLGDGRRGDREGVIRERLIGLTGSDSATVVNNNAAAVLIVLNTLAYGQEVLVSRGELIEIGGSFRLPEIMSRAGCRLVEVGTTNRTRIKDYAEAITEQTALLLKVHPSNFSIKGFTECATETQLSELSRDSGIPFVLDLGSGAIIDLQSLSIPREPLPGDSLKNGAHLVTFSGDKLLGGPQAGIIVGESQYIDQINSNPLKRALRMDKVSLALLDQTLKAYEDPATMHQSIKLVRDLTISQKHLRHRANSVVKVLQTITDELNMEVISSESVIGSGSQPDSRLPSLAVALSHVNESALHAFEKKLRQLKPAIIGRRHKSQLLLDMRGAEPLDEFLTTLQQMA